MSTINVKRGIQFRADLYRAGDRSAWLEAVGRQLERRGLAVTVGVNHDTKVVKNARDLAAAFSELEFAAKASGSTVEAYMADLLQALDDLAKADARTAKGDSFDLRRDSLLSKALGLHDGNQTNYASMSTTDFGVAAAKKPGATMKVGGVTLQVADPPPPIDLTNVPHISADSLKNAPPTWGREGEEVEDTRVVTGLSKEQVVGLATVPPGSPPDTSPVLNDLQRSRAAAGLALGVVPVDELSWSSEAHALRRANPYVSFTLDSRSLELNPKTGQQRVAVGRDFFFDTFLAKKDLRKGKLTKDLQKAGLMYRARIRYGSDRDPISGTRVLIGMKAGTAIDSDGTKHARKVDSRTDSASQAIFDTLTKAAQTGRLGPEWGSWSDGNIAPAASAMYRVAVQHGITDDLGGKEDVLALEPAAVARQIRGRFHLNETDTEAVLSAFQEISEKQLPALRERIAAAPSWPGSPNVPSREALLARADALVDHSAFVAAATDALKAIDPTLTVDKALVDRLWPSSPSSTSLSHAEVKLQRAVADAIRQEYDAFAADVRKAQRQIVGKESGGGSAGLVIDFLRQKAAIERVRSFSGVAEADTAGLVDYVKKLRDLPAGKEKTQRLSQLGVGTDQLDKMTAEDFASPVHVLSELTAKQVPEAFVSEFDRQLSESTREAFTAELATFLASKNAAALRDGLALKAAAPQAQGAAPAQAPAPAPASATPDAVAATLADLRTDLVGEALQIAPRMIEGAGAWAQALWFNAYRKQLLGIDPQGWNFLIASMDYTEFYKADVGTALDFKQRVSRSALDPSKMTGAMLSNDLQIELDSEKGYTSAVTDAQYGVNGVAAGLIANFARSRAGSGVQPGDGAAVAEQYFADLAAQRKPQREAWLAELADFAKSKGSPLDVRAAFVPLLDQVAAIRLLEAFARKSEATLAQTDRQTIWSWYASKMNGSDEAKNDFLTELARFAAEARSTVVISEDLVSKLDFMPFTEANAGLSVEAQRERVDKLAVAHEVWSMMKQAQRDLSAVRGKEVQRILRDNRLRNTGWDPPEKPKGDYAVDLALP